ncbi:MAG: hypothetical protein RR131_07545 [Anaerovorax sp.]
MAGVKRRQERNLILAMVEGSLDQFGQWVDNRAFIGSERWIINI